MTACASKVASCCLLFAFLFLLVSQHLQECTASSAPSSAPKGGSSSNSSNSNFSRPAVFVKVADFRIHHLEMYVVILLFIFVVVSIKILLHRIPRVSTYVPESCVLLLLGVLSGVVLKYVPLPSSVRSVFNLGNDTFFFFLLPPIVLEAAYGLQNREFYAIFGRILLFAVVGTVVSALLITLLLFAVVKLHWVASDVAAGLPVLQIAYFTSFIVAVDPVAVLAIFEELGVELSLYFLVFGESLFNDAVTIVLYNIMQVLMQQPELDASQVVLGVVSFFTISVGGAIVGVICGVLSCLLTRAASDIEPLQPLIIVLLGYFSYVLGDLFGWSGIISIIACGIIHNAYAFHNIANKSAVTVKRVVRMMAQLSEAVIFLFLGIELLAREHYWEWSFILWSLFFCLVVRAIVIFGFCGIMNWRINRPSHRIDLGSQIIITYGGLRGAVAYALAAVIPDDILPPNAKGMFMSTTLVIVLVTNLVMGTTMKPLVRLLHIQLREREQWSVFREMSEYVVEQANTIAEEIAGHVGSHRLLSWFVYYNDTYLKRFLLNEPVAHNAKIVQTYQKVSMALHMATVCPDQADFYLNRVYNKSTRSISGLVKPPTELALDQMVHLPGRDVPDTSGDEEIGVRFSINRRKSMGKPSMRDAFRAVKNRQAFQSMRFSRDGDQMQVMSHAVEVRRRLADMAVTQWKSKTIPPNSKVQRQLSLPTPTEEGLPLKASPEVDDDRDYNSDPDFSPPTSSSRHPKISVASKKYHTLGGGVSFDLTEADDEEDAL